MKQENRLQPRLPMTGDVRLQVTGQAAQQGEVADLSQSGCALWLSTSPSEGAQVFLTLLLTTERQLVQVDGRIVSCRLEHGRYLVGVQFVRFMQGMQALLRALSPPQVVSETYSGPERRHSCYRELAISARAALGEALNSVDPRARHSANRSLHNLMQLEQILPKRRKTDV